MSGTGFNTDTESPELYFKWVSISIQPNTTTTTPAMQHNYIPRLLFESNLLRQPETSTKHLLRRTH
jgi:hypothetical protein